MDGSFAAALALDDLRHAAGEVPFGRGVRGPEGDMELTGPEHAMHGDATLCGLRAEDVVVVRHLWSATGGNACAACRLAGP